MKCENAHRRMLEADPQELSPGDATELGTHLGVCATCRGIAGEMRSQHELLGNGYRAMNPRRDAEELAAAVFAAARRERKSIRRSRPVAHARRRRGVLVAGALLVPLAAALILFAAGPSADVPAELLDEAATPAQVTLELPPEQNAIVFRTRNPAITVVWLYPGESP